jgi:hypothetical protein
MPSAVTTDSAPVPRATCTPPAYAMVTATTEPANSGMYRLGGRVKVVGQLVLS